MSFEESILKLLNKIYREELFVQALVKAHAKSFDFVDGNISKVRKRLFFDELDEAGCQWWENAMKIAPKTSQSIADRQSAIQAKWLSNIDSSVEAIQVICDSWEKGEAEVDFVGGKIQVKFIGDYGVPSDLESLLEAVGDVKPAHLAYQLLYKYLLIEDIHENKTLEEMEALTLGQFAGGIE